MRRMICLVRTVWRTVQYGTYFFEETWFRPRGLLWMSGCEYEEQPDGSLVCRTCHRKSNGWYMLGLSEPGERR
jgi:hypothetical protein